MMGSLLSLCGLVIVATATAQEETVVGFPAAGTRLVFEKTSGKQKEILKWIAVDDTQYKGRTVHRLIGENGFEYYDAGTKSWIATVIDGKTREVTPHNGQLSPTLWVGKTWNAEYLYPRRDGSQSLQKKTWRVEAKEPVTVPAGTFDTYRIKSEDKALTITLWYAPSINFYVKRKTEGTVQVEQQLIEYKQPQDN